MSRIEEYEYVVEREEFDKQENGKWEYCWKEVAICKTFEQAASILSQILDKNKKYRARYIGQEVQT